MEMTRLAQEADFIKLVDIINRAYRSQGGWTTEALLVRKPRISLQALQEQAKEHTVIVCEVDELCGCILLEKYKDGFLLGLFAVDPLVQSKGCGTRLMNAAMAEAQSQAANSHSIGHVNLYMWVLEGRQELLDWYLKVGFTDTGERLPFIDESLLIDKSLKFIVLKKSSS